MPITKERYIELHGEEAWEKRRQERIEYNKKWREEHPDYAKQKGKEWRKNNYEKATEYDKQYRESHREKQHERDHKRYRDNPEKEKQRRREYYTNNKEKTLETNHRYSKSKEGRATKLCLNYLRDDNNMGREGFNLERNWVVDHIFNSSCIYCDDSNWKHLGCDRIDNDLPHTPDNVVCSCGICNIERAIKKMSVEEFIEYRKEHPRDVPITHQQVVEINGKKVIKKVG